jgi:hypothetical protein
MLPVKIAGDRAHIGERFSVSFQRTLRIPDDGRLYPLPPGLGVFPLQPVERFADRLPKAWSAEPSVFIPMYQREALWLGFDAAPWKPNAVKIGIGGIDAVSGEAWDDRLRANPQNYLICPDQPWLDGINAGEGHVRQFVAMPLGSGETVEGQLTGIEQTGGIQIRVFEPKPSRFPDTPPPASSDQGPDVPFALGGLEMGLGAGGRMKQDIYEDPYGIDTWDIANSGSVSVYIVNSEQYGAITGLAAPESPVSAEVYTAHGLPWFDLYEEKRRDIPASGRLSRVKSVGELEAGRGGTSDRPVNVPPEQVRIIDRTKSGRGKAERRPKGRNHGSGSA